jgi:hypothetical protein
MDFITRIRSKSPHVRMQYALGMAGVVTGIITAIWLSTIPARFDGLGTHATTTETKQAAQDPGNAEAPAKAEPEAQALGSLQMNGEGATSTATTSLGTVEAIATTSASSSAPRVIQIGTTSQNAR